MENSSQADVFLDARCQLALARVKSIYSEKSAARDALSAAVAVYDYMLGAEMVPTGIHWAIASEPVLVFARGICLAIRATCEQNIESSEKKIKQDQLDEDRWLAERQASYPSPKELLKKLRNGGGVELNGHSLIWEKDSVLGRNFESFGEESGVLGGDNAYGQPYMWSDTLDLASVSSWRHEMVMGNSIGACDEPVFWDKSISVEYQNLQLERLGRNLLLTARVIFGNLTKLEISNDASDNLSMVEGIDDAVWSLISVAESSEQMDRIEWGARF